MYKNTIKINYDISKIINIGKEVPWQDQCILTELMIKYVPSHISNIIPTDNGSEIHWDSEESFKNLLSENLYLKCLEIMSRYDITVEWN